MFIHLVFQITDAGRLSKAEINSHHSRTGKTNNDETQSLYRIKRKCWQVAPVKHTLFFSSARREWTDNVSVRSRMHSNSCPLVTDTVGWIFITGGAAEVDHFLANVLQHYYNYCYIHSHYLFLWNGTTLKSNRLSVPTGPPSFPSFGTERFKEPAYVLKRDTDLQQTI